MSRNRNRIRKCLRITRNVSLIVLLFVASLVITYNIVARVSIPEVEDPSAVKKTRHKISEDSYRIEQNWLRKNNKGLWEMYLEGEPFQMGVINGKLSKELILIQEQAFVNQISEFIPSRSYLKFLKYFIGWFNRDLEDHIINEYKKEIYGVSLSASDQFNYISQNYQRMLNYHAAHDIGHALQDLALVGCTSFAVTNSQDDNSLVIGRNFDFYINDDFARNKIVAFVKPDQGYKFMYVTWASMIGVVSGMNEQGLTVTINAAKSEIPYRSATPISLLAREILQYAKDTCEAIEIARSRKTFVSESILIGSALDNMAVVIEKSPSKLDVYTSGRNYLVSSNHFQSGTFSEDELNLQQIRESASLYRQQRCEELILQQDGFSYTDAADVLRDKRGLGAQDIGIGNEKAMNQMISHHSIIFMPGQLLVWVSTQPYQLGEYLAYDLNYVFENSDSISNGMLIHDTVLTIPADPFLYSPGYKDYLEFTTLSGSIRKCIREKRALEKAGETIEHMISLNPEYYLGYLLGGDYYYDRGDFDKALKYYNISLSKEMETRTTEDELLEKLKSISEIKGNTATRSD